MSEARFAEIVTSVAEIRPIVGEPTSLSVNKTVTRLDEHCRAFIAQSPFLLIASCDAHGRMDVSPKGDPPGFVQVLDEQTLAIPDRPGNRRIDTFGNLLQNPRIGLLFLVPGYQETLRINGSALIVRDLSLRTQMATRGKVPEFALVVSVEEAFFHCAKCIIRSQLWDEATQVDSDTLPSLARILVDHGKLTQSVEQTQALIDESYSNRLY